MPTRLPDFPLISAGPATQGCRERGMGSYREVALWALQLPYGRGADREDLAILREGRGTCSTKHALLARLAREHGVDVELVLGIYLMDGRNTPGVGRVLATHGLPAIPEAHCVLRWNRQYIDLTRAGAREPSFIHEECIRPEDIVTRKVATHRRFMAQWMTTNLPGWTLDSAWRVREACIAALAEL
jgi:hypothetical protein